MRIGFILYWCVFILHLCKADDAERSEKDGGRREKWGPVVRSGSFVTDPAFTASNDQSKLVTLNFMVVSDISR